MSKANEYSSILREHADKETDPGLIKAPLLIEIAEYIDNQDKRIKELEEIYFGQIRVIARSRITHKEKVERIAALSPRMDEVKSVLPIWLRYQNPFF